VREKLIRNVGAKARGYITTHCAKGTILMIALKRTSRAII